jgi:hypothetical protein
MGKYDPLRDELIRRRGQGRVTYTYPQIEQVLGQALPPVAYTTRPWWANETNPKTSHVQCRAWLGAGWTVEDVILGTTVTFIEIPTATRTRARRGHTAQS